MAVFEPGKSSLFSMEGYDTNGPDTLGAGYARENPEVKPDAAPPAGIKMYVDGRRALGFTTGESVSFLRNTQATVLVVSSNGVILDTRSIGVDDLPKLLNPDQLVLWRGVYWHCSGVRGVFVTLQFWGTRIRKRGARVFYRRGRPYVAAAREG